MRELDSKTDDDYFSALDRLLSSNALSPRGNVENFTRFSPVPSLSRFMARYEIFKQIIEVPGVVIDAGVFHGFSLFTWAKLSAILEPTNHTRRVIGFDTFSGFPSVAEEDGSSISSEMHAGGYQGFRYKSSTESHPEGGARRGRRLRNCAGLFVQKPSSRGVDASSRCRPV